VTGEDILAKFRTIPFVELYFIDREPNGYRISLKAVFVYRDQIKPCSWDYIVSEQEMRNGLVILDYIAEMASRKFMFEYWDWATQVKELE
jgi:hypothetical protein